MAKVFTITEGLENMGAMKTGGQGSVYKGRRIGEIFSAIKILPTPIHSESPDDKNFTAFRNEVQKLKKVNETPDPNVVKILNSGITDSGNFPFIEMEFIEGPDLAELLMPPHDSVFTIKEVLKVAEQLSHALAHCHKMDVRHGDIKSNNIKFNRHTGNYVLLDFGLAIMSDEQRRTSLRHAGAIEFMAPEQNEGQMLFQTDVYSFGVILFELLAGTVPFPLEDKGETARNMVMIAHMETSPPNPLILRHQALPASWNEEKKQHEMQVPNFLLNMIYTCLQKNPADRFANGMDLHDYFLANSFSSDNNAPASETLTALRRENKMLVGEIERLQRQLLRHQQGTMAKDTPDLTNSGVKHSNVFLWKKLLLIVLIVIASAILIFFLVKTNISQGKQTGPATDSSTLKDALKISKADDSVIFVDKINAALNDARAELSSNDLAAALVIYKDLAKKEIPEAMYEYGNLALQNNNNQIDCRSAFSLILKAADKGYVPAKRTAGFLYAFADDPELLKQGNYDRCIFLRNVPEGAKLLMEAMLEGDSAANRLLDNLNFKNSGHDYPDSFIVQ